VNFTYSSTAALTNNYLGTSYLSSDTMGKPYIGPGGYAAYQLGLNRSLANIVYGDMDDRNDFGGMRYRWQYPDRYDLYKDDSRAVNRSIQLSTSLGITKPIDLQLSSISLRWSRQYDAYPDTNKRNQTINFPELSLGGRSGVLEKVKFIAKYVQGMNLSSNFSFRQSRNASLSAGKTRGRTIEFSPLLSFDGTVKKWPIRFNYQHTLSQDGKESQGTASGGGKADATKTLRDGDNLEMSYELPQTSGLSTIKLYKWNIPVKGKTSMGMRFSRDHSVTTVGSEKTADNSNLSATPHLSYIFTDNVTGTLEYTGSRVTQNGSVTTTNTMALIAEIRF
jgi:hypothetical protein